MKQTILKTITNYNAGQQYSLARNNNKSLDLAIDAALQVGRNFHQCEIDQAYQYTIHYTSHTKECPTNETVLLCNGDYRRIASIARKHLEHMGVYRITVTFVSGLDLEIGFAYIY